MVITNHAVQTTKMTKFYAAGGWAKSGFHASLEDAAMSYAWNKVMVPLVDLGNGLGEVRPGQ